VRNAKLSGARSPFRTPRQLATIAAKRAQWSAEARAEGKADAEAGKLRRLNASQDYVEGYRDAIRTLAGCASVCSDDCDDDESADYYAEMADARGL
jgi:hypothetical protein